MLVENYNTVRSYMQSYERMSISSIWYTYISPVLAWKIIEPRERQPTLTLDKYKGTARTMGQTQLNFSRQAKVCI